jgi:hypothetical protein
MRETTPSEIATDWPINNANKAVPTPKVPPNKKPAESAIISKTKRTLPTRTPVR